MTSKKFLDTNILVYAVDRHDKTKQLKSRNLLKSLAEENLGVLSTQVLQEFFVTLTKKLGVDPLAAKDILSSFEHFEVVTVNAQLINEAIDISIINIISFWDSLIMAAAKSANCDEVLTEDLNHGQIIKGVRVVNPFDQQRKE